MTREEFIRFAEKSQGDLRRFLVALCCGDRMLADEIAQETYVKAYLSCDGFKDNSKFKAWIHKIAYNTFLNQKRNTRNFAEISEIENTKSAENNDPFKYQELYSALQLLKPNERSVILLYYLDGYSVKEIADITAQNSSSVRKLMQRGRDHLRNLLTLKD